MITCHCDKRGQPSVRRSGDRHRCRWLDWLRRITAAGVIFLLATGCAGSALRLDREAKRLGFSRSVASGSRFRHVIYFKAGRPVSLAPAAENGTWALHVYLDGDGTPWLDEHTVASDPTPRNPLMLRLMALDPAPSLYLGRPCYHGLAEDGVCEPYYWTHGRYAPEVVESLAAALNHWLSGRHPGTVTLLGLSGGGTLAMLLAPRIPQVRAVVTLGANLDVDRWADRHGYSHLAGSLNPASQPPLPGAIRQYHWVGALDRNVPPEIVSAVAAHQPNAEFTILPGCDHVSCWERAWPSILLRLDR